MKEYIVLVQIGFICYVQIFLLIAGSEYLEVLVARHMFYKCKLVWGNIEEFKDSIAYRHSKGAGEYFVNVKYKMGECYYTNAIVRCKDDYVGKKVLLAANKNKTVVRYYYEKTYRDSELMSPVVLYVFFTFWILAFIVMLLLMHVIFQSLFFLFILVTLNYLFLPLHLTIRNCKWKITRYI